jgi:hypothetical protein
MTGSSRAEGWAGSWKTAWSAAASVFAVPSGLPVPGLRAEAGTREEAAGEGHGRS